MRKIISLLVACLLLLPLALVGCTQNATDNSIYIVLASGEDPAAATLLQQAFASQWGWDCPIVAEADAPGKGTEILVGHTAQPQSQQAAAGLRAEDYAITFSPTQIAIVGGSEAATAEAAQYFASNFMHYYVEDYLLPNDPSVNYTSYGPYPLQSFVLDGSSIGEYALVTADGAEHAAAVYLKENLEAATGYTFAVVAPGQLAEGQRGIIFGSSRQAQAAQLAASLAAQEYLVQSDGTHLYLCAGNSGDELVAAKMLVLRLMGYDPYNNTAAERQLQLAGVNKRFTTQITKTEGYEVLLQQVFRLPAEGVFTVFQGGCTDGVYAYYIMNNQTHHPYTSYIYKVDTRDWSVVARSEELPLDHANSLAYNGVTDQLVVSNYEPNYTTLSVVDPHTLTLTKRVTVDFNALSITHNANRDEYAIGLSGTYNFIITDSSFNVLSYNEGPNFGHIKQEVDCDDDYIYFNQSNENHIIVHDWQGNYITDVKLGMYIEVENMINIDGRIYTGYFTNGGLVYETIIYRDI